MIGDYATGHVVNLYALIAHSYAGEHEQAIAVLPRIPQLYWLNSSLPAGRSYLALGQLDRAGELLNRAWDGRLWFSGPQMYEEQRALRTMLARFYLGKLAYARGSRADGAEHLRYFLDHVGKGASPLAQVAEARALLAQ